MSTCRQYNNWCLILSDAFCGMDVLSSFVFKNLSHIISSWVVVGRCGCIVLSTESNMFQFRISVT